MKQTLTHLWRFFTIYAVALLAFCMEWQMFKADVGISYPNFIATAVKCVGDCCLILLPYFLVRPRWRWSIVLPLWAYSIWCLSNLAYFRFWHDLIPPAAITMGSNVNLDLIGYALSLLNPADALYLIIPLCATAFVIVVNPAHDPSLTRKIKLSATGISLFVFLLGQASYFISHRSWLREEFNVTSTSEALKNHFLGDRVSPIARYTIDGAVMHFVHFPIEAIGQILSATDLSADEETEIIEMLSDYVFPSDSAAFDVDTMNVVYVIVESLNADVLNRTVNGLRIAPTLDSLAAKVGTVVMNNVVSQVKLSNSSDGHLLLLTGLLPPEKIAFCFRFGQSNKFHSLADAMPRHFKHVYLADNGQFWNEKNVLQNFGLGDVSANDDSSMAKDEYLFNSVAEAIDTISHPFFITLVTMSMHMPFRETTWPVPAPISSDKGLSDAEKNYLAMTHYFDRCLGRFVSKLPENTILIVASDHSVSLTGCEIYPPALFMAVNVGRTEQISRTVGQVNLFPATLELLNLRISGYGGVAPSALNPCVNGSMDANRNIYGNPSPVAIDSLERAFRLSDLIIRSNAFAR